jgi:hypothetical protein
VIDALTKFDTLAATNMKDNPAKGMSVFDVSVKYSKTSSIKTKQIHFFFCGQAFIQIDRLNLFIPCSVGSKNDNMHVFLPLSF